MSRRELDIDLGHGAEVREDRAKTEQALAAAQKEFTSAAKQSEAEFAALCEAEADHVLRGTPAPSDKERKKALLGDFGVRALAARVFGLKKRRSDLEAEAAEVRQNALRSGKNWRDQEEARLVAAMEQLTNEYVQRAFPIHSRGRALNSNRLIAFARNASLPRMGRGRDYTFPWRLSKEMVNTPEFREVSGILETIRTASKETK